MKYLIEQHLNKTENCFECEPIETPLEDTIINNLPELYHYGIKEYGKCISKIYINYKNSSYHIGYVFLQRVKYIDCNDTYLHETWISIENIHKEVKHYAGGL